MHWFFGRRKYMPRHTASVFRFAAVITAQCDAPFNIPLYQCAFCSVTAHAHRKSIVRSNNAPTGNFYVVYLFLFAVLLLCYGNAGKISFTNLLPALFTCTDNIALPGFLYFYTFTWCFFKQNHNFYSFPTDLRNMMSINSYYALISLYEWMAETRVFLYHTHTHWSARESCGHKHTNNISRTALRVTSSAFHSFIWVKLASYHIHTETATRQNKSLV